MPEFGVIIIENPGPATEFKIHGLSGCEDEELSTWDKANMIAERARQQGHLAHVLTAFNPDEGEGHIQIETYDREEAENAGCISDDEDDESGDGEEKE